MFKRTIKHKLLKLKDSFPVLALFGPRQSGKTTLTRTLFPHHRYINLESFEEQELAVEDPRGFLERYHHSLPPNLYFWRDKTGNEVDCILEEGSRLTPLEIKSSETIHSEMFAGLAKWCNLADTPGKGTVIYADEEDQQRPQDCILSWKHL